MQAVWVCCQLGARERYAVARALHRHRALELVVTDAWLAPRNPIGHIRAGLQGRFHPDLADANIHSDIAGLLAFELQAKYAGREGWQRIIARNQWFQKMANRRLSKLGVAPGPRTIMAYSYAAREIFKLARARGWRTVLGQ